MSTILKGAPVVAAMNEANAARCAALREKGVVPTLAVVRVGERPDDLSYEKGVMARCAKVGVEVKQFLLPADASQEELLRVIAGINADAAIHGCLLFRPLPKQFDDRTIRAALSPEKDIDGITDGSLAGVFTNTAVGYPPCTAQACLEILKFYNIPLSGRRAVVVGRSLVVGKPAAMMLDRENATVTLCNSRTQNLPDVCREADVVVVAMGRMGFIGAEHLRAGQVVVDVGIHVNEEGKLCGDALITAYVEGKRFQVGRAGGLTGRYFARDVEDGSWRNQLYETSSAPLEELNSNWFTLEAFVSETSRAMK